MAPYVEFVYVPTLSEEIAVNVLKALKSAMVVIGVPWALKTNNSLAMPLNNSVTICGPGRLPIFLASPTSTGTSHCGEDQQTS